MALSGGARRHGTLSGIGFGSTLVSRATTVALSADVPWTVLTYFLYARLYALQGADRYRLLYVYVPLALAKTVFVGVILPQRLAPADRWLAARQSPDDAFLQGAKAVFEFRDSFAFLIAIAWGLLCPATTLAMHFLFPGSVPPLDVVVPISITLGAAQCISTWMQGVSGAPAVLGPELAIASEEAERRGLVIPVRQIAYNTLLILLAFAFALTPTFWMFSIAYMIWYRAMTSGSDAGALHALSADRFTLFYFTVLMLFWAPPGAWLMSRGVVYPVKQIAMAVRRAAEARSAAAAGRVPLYTLDEMGDLADAVNAMVTRLAEADTQIRGQVRELRALDDLKDQFLRVAAHELKTPVAIVKGYAQLLTNRAAELPPEVRPLLAAMDRGSDRINQLVDNFLSMTQLQMGRVPFVLTPVDVTKLVEEIVERARAAVPLQPLEFEASEPVHVRADRVRLQRAIEAVVTNAMTFSPERGVIRVIVESDPERQEAIVRVRDQGVGIPADKQARIFESFYRAHTDTPYDYGGMGIGLYLARETLLRHDGAIGFVSKEGKGSTFIVRLPLLEERARA